MPAATPRHPRALPSALLLALIALAPALPRAARADAPVYLRDHLDVLARIKHDILWREARIERHERATPAHARRGRHGHAAGERLRPGVYDE
ncbi:MAG TPA: hypothetical protein VGU27_11055, partial [Candidatus Eisenbacteria bacterium]|nr:hypothetical protein [Candidatus Eisenbacteria bacterium]